MSLNLIAFIPVRWTALGTAAIIFAITVGLYPGFDLGMTGVSYAAVPEPTGEFTMESLRKRLKACRTAEEVGAFCRDFTAHSADFDLVRAAQDAWERADTVAAVAFYRSRYEQNRNSARDVYLYGRLSENNLEKIRLGREIIHLDPKWPYGYRLLTVTYNEALFRNASNPDTIELYGSLFEEDAELFPIFANVDPGKPFPLSLLLYCRLYQEDYLGAQKTIDRLDKIDRKLVQGPTRARVLCELGRHGEAFLGFVHMVKGMAEKGQIDTTERDRYLRYYFFSTLKTTGDYDIIVDKIEEIPEEKRSAEDYQMLADGYAKLGKKKKALNALEASADAGRDRPDQVAKDPDLESLRSDSRWNGILKKIQTNWDRGAGRREAEILAKRLDKLPPDWTLQTAEGKKISLGDMKGKPVILHLWLAWNPQSKLALPKLSEFVRENQYPGVRVIAVNIDANRPATLEYLRGNNPGVEVLFLDSNQADSFGVKSIPYTCAFDRDGVMRFEAKGFDVNLVETLGFWSEDMVMREEKK